MVFSIRDLRDYDEMVALRRLQHEIWGFDEPGTGLYPPLLLTAAKNGGVVLGAFDEVSGQMVGFLFSFLGREAGGPFKLCSQVMGVHKAWRGQGIAEALKQIQRQRTVVLGLPLITWTFDPLEAPNAYLNLHKLRAISRTYWRDVYGSNFGALNAGLPTDRLLMEWWVDGIWLAHAGGIEDDIADEAPAIFETTGSGAGLEILQVNLAFDADVVYLEIPADVHPVKRVDMALAADWRLKVRHAFEVYFGKGYIAVDFVSVQLQGERRNRYVLQKATPELLGKIGVIMA